MKILVVGPSPEKSKGGMATVIKGIRDDKKLNDQFDIDIFDSYIDGSKVARAIYTILAFLRFRIIYKKYDLFHIHVASYGSTFRKAKYVNFLKKHGKKVIMHIHGAAYMDFYSKLSDKRKKYVADVLNICDRVIALSDEWKDRFERTFGLKNCISIPNGIDTDEFKCAITSEGEYTNNFLLLGRLGKRKGVYDLVDAVEIISKLHPEVRLYMAGDGEIDQVKELVNRKNLQNNIEVVGWVDFAGKIELLKKVATIILPSYNEGLPMAILEGMAAGKAIISTKVGAIPEVVKEENGFIIPPGDVSALVETMKKCLKNTGMLAAMGQTNIKKIDEYFSMKKMHRTIAECYMKVIKDE